jgi:hypothetical protein
VKIFDSFTSFMVSWMRLNPKSWVFIIVFVGFARETGRPIKNAVKQRID